MNSDELIAWLLDVTETALSNSTAVSVATPSDHVDITSAHDETTYPFVGIEPISLTPESAGLGNDTLVADSVITNNSGDVTGVTDALRRSFSIDVIPVTDDDPATRDALTDELTFAFAQRADSGDTPEDIHDLSVGESTPRGRPDSFVRANGTQLDGVLVTRADRTLPTAQTVEWSIVLTEGDTDVDYGDPYGDTYDETDVYPENY
jgi:hypothetical protein